MKLQRSNYSCGATALVNAVRCYGKRVSEYKVRTYTNTTKEEGADEDGIRAGISALDFLYNELDTEKKAEAWDWLEAQLLIKKAPVICCVDSWSHWVAVIGKAADRLIIIDSSNTLKNKRENGVHVISKNEFMKKWKCKANSAYYGISVIKKARNK